MAKQKYTDQQHYLIRSLVLVNEVIEPLWSSCFDELVGVHVPSGTIEMARKDARKLYNGRITSEQYFRRTSQSKRKESK